MPNSAPIDPPMEIEIPALCLIILIGTTSSGKSTFAKRFFKPTEIVSSDALRALISDDENDQSVTAAAFEMVHQLIAKRLEKGRLTVVDATNIEAWARLPLRKLARKYQTPRVAIVFDLDESTLLARHRARSDRAFGENVVRSQHKLLRQTLAQLDGEGFSQVIHLRSPGEIEALRITRRPLACNGKSQQGPFDLIGDVHGCFDELCQLLDRLGYRRQLAEPTGPNRDPRFLIEHPEGRQLIFLGDLVDRGPKIGQVLRLVMDVVESGAGKCVLGNHEVKLLKRLKGRNVSLGHGLEQSVQQLAEVSPEFLTRTICFIEGLPDHLVLDGGRLVAAHAGLREHLQGRQSNMVRNFALYGETSGETDAFGFPVRYNWARTYRGSAMVVYGHVPVAEAVWLNHTICIDTGCVFGGRLTALRYPERELVGVAAKRVHYPSSKPLTRLDEDKIIV